jgi:hypothetical protein
MPGSVRKNDEVEAPERGVYWARHRKDGRLIVYAIDSGGNEVRPRLVLRDESQKRTDEAVEYLWNHLDAIDPVSERPALQLVRRLRLPSVERPPAREYDPYDLPPLPFPRR